MARSIPARARACLAGALLAAPALADDNIVPERYNQGPRVLFNIHQAPELDEIVPGQFYQRYWHGPRLTIQTGRFLKGPTGHVKTVPGYHGEELILMLKGRLRFDFPDSGKAFEIGPGDVFHFPNILHGGACITDECQFMGIYTPNRPDFGPEGTPMTVESNDALAR